MCGPKSKKKKNNLNSQVQSSDSRVWEQAKQIKGVKKYKLPATKEINNGI